MAVVTATRPAEAVAVPRPQPGSQPRPGTFLALDAWRGFASLWVAMYHMALVITYRYPHLRANPVYAFSLEGGLGVQLFFVISGYCIANAAAVAHARGRGWGAFMKARLRRIYPACWAALLLTGALSVAAELASSSGRLGPSTMADKHLLGQSPLYFLANATLTQGLLRQQSLIVQTWTLCYEMAFYLLVGLAMAAAARRWGERGMLSALHLLTASALTVLVVSPRLLRYPFDLWPEFGLGVLVYDLLRHRDSRAARLWGVAVAALFVTFVVRHDALVGLMPGESRRPFAVSFGFALLLLATHRADERLSRSRPFRALAWVGAFSYSLYLTHTLTIGVVNQIYKALRLPEAFHAAAFVTVLAAALLFAQLFYRYCERPFLRQKGG